MSEQRGPEGAGALEPVAILQMTTGVWVSQSIYVAAKLGIADLLKTGPKSCDELAEAVQVDASSLYRVMRALVGVGVFAEGEAGRFELTPVGASLQTGVPGSMRALAIMVGEEHYRAWGDFLHNIRTGETAFDHVFGMGVYDYLSQNQEAAVVFDDAMTAVTSLAASALVAVYDFPPFNKVVDVGGGQGTLIATILKANPEVKGVLFDAPHVVENAKKYLKAAELDQRCQVVAGDFFDSVPGGDVYTLSQIIHNWDDERSVAILKNCCRAMTGDGKVVLVEMVLPADNTPSLGHLFDLNMMVMTGGRERTESEFRTLFNLAGFRLTNIIPTESPVSVIEAVPV